MRRHIDLIRDLTRRLDRTDGLAAAAAAAGDPAPLLELEARRARRLRGGAGDGPAQRDPAQVG